MRIRKPRLWIALASTAALLFVVLGDIERESPGPLAAVQDLVNHQKYQILRFDMSSDLDFYDQLPLLPSLYLLVALRIL